MLNHLHRPVDTSNPLLACSVLTDNTSAHVLSSTPLRTHRPWTLFIIIHFMGPVPTE